MVFAGQLETNHLFCVVCQSDSNYNRPLLSHFFASHSLSLEYVLSYYDIAMYPSFSMFFMLNLDSSRYLQASRAAALTNKNQIGGLEASEACRFVRRKIRLFTPDLATAAGGLSGHSKYSRFPKII